VSLKREVECGIQQRMTRTYKGSQHLTRGRNDGFVKNHSLIPLLDGVATPNLAIPCSDRAGNARDLEAMRLALPGDPSQTSERFEEEVLDITGLQPSRLCALHLFPDSSHSACIHCVMSQGSFFQ
jgi:hypothetical protein